MVGPWRRPQAGAGERSEPRAGHRRENGSFVLIRVGSHGGDRRVNPRAY